MDFIVFQNGPQPTLILKGCWTLSNLSAIEHAFKALRPALPTKGSIFINCMDIEEIDTAAMLFFIQLRREMRLSLKVSVTGVRPEFLRLFRVMLRYCPAGPTHNLLQQPVPDTLYRIGKTAINGFHDLLLFLELIGRICMNLARSLIHPSTVRIQELAVNLQNVGVQALPIIALSAMLIGIVIAFQSAVQLKNYGANIFIVDMVGISIPRELSPLITAIVVAGRSASAFTAQIGAMRVTDELDAMKTLGFEPYRFIILPRILATVIAMPLLIFFSNVIGIYAGILVSSLQLNISPAQFLERLEEAVSVRHYVIGLIKGPFFALAISSIGCFRGLQVSKNTQSIGRYTTISVVNSIFTVILIDALFSVILTELDL
jgi:phospholipid/cholesterol/gamma-HCH transport system permease protein